MRDRNRNNFDLLRFAFASIVFLVHAHVLSQRDELSALSRILSTDIAIRGFFVISGYLVLMSFEAALSLRDYFEKRIRRVYPAYALVIVACGIAGAFLTTRPLREYLAGLLPYWLSNLSFLNFLSPELPGVFEGNPARAVNGALWTLKVEVGFYVLLPLLALAARRRFGWLFYVLLYASSLAYAALLLELYRRSGDDLLLRWSYQLPGQLAYFATGMALYTFRGRLAPWLPYLAAAAVAFYAAKQYVAVPALETLAPAFNTLALALSTLALALGPLALGVLVIYLATQAPCLGNFGRFGDLSYGIYIYHFPVLQVLIGAGWFSEHPVPALLAAAVLVLGLAFLSWHLVEKRFLRTSSHYVVAARQPAPSATGVAS